MTTGKTIALTRWTLVDIEQEAVIKNIPKKKKCKKEKWLSEEALQIAEKRKETKGKGEEEKYTLVTEWVSEWKSLSCVRLFATPWTI